MQPMLQRCRYVCPTCGSELVFKDSVVSDLMICWKCRWEDSYLKARREDATNNAFCEQQEVHDCLDCGERYIVLPHDCHVAERQGRPPRLRARYVSILPPEVV